MLGKCVNKLYFICTFITILFFLFACSPSPETEYFDIPSTPILQVQTNDSSVFLSWAKISDAEGYFLYWSVDPEEAEKEWKQIRLQDHHFLHENLDNETVYFYFVVSFNQGGQSQRSQIVSATPIPILAQPELLPFDAEQNQVKVRWQPVQQADEYEVVLSLYATTQTKNSGRGLTQTIAVGQETSFVIEDIAENQFLYFSVRALRKGMVGVVSETVAVAKAPKISIVENNQSLNIRWEKIIGAEIYEVFWSTSRDLPLNQWQSVETIATQQELNGLSNDQPYYIRVMAKQALGWSLISDPSSGTPFETLEQMQFFSAVSSETEISFTWSANLDADAYVLFIAADNRLTKDNYWSLPAGRMIEVGRVNNYSASFLIPGMVYYAMVAAKRNNVIGTPSNQIAVSLRTLPPLNISQEPLNQSVLIDWALVPDAVNYNVYVAAGSGVTIDNSNDLADWKMFRGVKPPYFIYDLINGKEYSVIISANNSLAEPSHVSEEIRFSPNNKKGIVTGKYHNCYVGRNKKLWCWGWNDSGQLGVGAQGEATSRADPVEVISNNLWIDVAAGGQHSCGLTTQGQIACWGKNYAGSLGIGGNSNLLQPSLFLEKEDWVDFSLGHSHSCAIDRSRDLYCWGGNTYGELGIGTASTNRFPVKVTNSSGGWYSIHLGYDHSCAIGIDKSVWCWGKNLHYELGDGTNTNKSLPVKISDEKWLQLSLAESHTCGVKVNGSLWCWGQNTYDKTGAGIEKISVFSKTPQRLGNDNDWQAVSIGANHSCALKQNGDLFCWGDNSYGQIGYQSNDRLVSFASKEVVGQNFESLSSGKFHTCASKVDNSQWCWGANTHNQLAFGYQAFGMNAYVTTPLKIGQANNWSQLALGDGFSCGIRTDHSLWCWGGNQKGQLGLNNFVMWDEPNRVAGSTQWRSIDAGLDHSCALDSENKLFCWGSAENAKLGRESPMDVAVPTQELTESVHWSSISLGKSHSCGLKLDGSVWCWGQGASGQLAQGVDDLLSKFVATPAVSDLLFERLSLAGDHSCAVRSEAMTNSVLDNALWCWGSSLEIRNGLSENATYPVRIAENQQWIEIRTGINHSCARDAQQQIWCWGNNQFANLGAGDLFTLNQSDTPIALAAIPSLNWKSISPIKGDHTCAISRADEVYCWGSNSHGQLATGAWNIEYKQNTPYLINNSEWLDVKTGANHSCGIQIDGSLWCWGGNDLGQVGAGISARFLPLLIELPL